MTLSERTVETLRNNFLLVISLAFTALPILLISIFLAVKYLITLVTEDALWFLLATSIWIGMFFLLAAIIYRRIKKEESYSFLFVLTLFAVQAFIVFEIKFAIPPIILFGLLYYRLFRFYKSREERKKEESAGGRIGARVWKGKPFNPPLFFPFFPRPASQGL